MNFLSSRNARGDQIFSQLPVSLSLYATGIELYNVLSGCHSDTLFPTLEAVLLALTMILRKADFSLGTCDTHTGARVSSQRLQIDYGEFYVGSGPFHLIGIFLRSLSNDSCGFCVLFD